jgi:hypothetical protein
MGTVELLFVFCVCMISNTPRTQLKIHFFSVSMNILLIEYEVKGKNVLTKYHITTKEFNK